MSDLIDRQEAIDRINKQREHLQPDVYPQDKIGDAAYRICAEFIERLPSAQPTQSNAPNTLDAISRQEAIDSIESIGYIATLQDGDFALRKSAVDYVLRNLPPAQPEITLEIAIDYLHKIGWMQEHDRILTESTQPEKCEDCGNFNKTQLLIPQPEPKIGKWKETDDGWDGTYYVCSECGCPWTLIDGTPFDNGMNYCPNCGTKMEEEEEI